jgi:putative membrane protein
MSFGRQVTLCVWIAGIAVIVALTGWFGAADVGRAIASAGWATAGVIVIRIVGVAGAGVGWWLLFPRDVQPPLTRCISFRFIREAANALLPMAQVGGDIIGARCLALRGTRGTVAAASVIVDVMIQAATQLVFALIGLVLLLKLGGHAVVAWPAAIGIAIAVPALGGFLVAQGESGQRLLKNALAFVVNDRDWHAFGAIDNLYARLKTFYANRSGLIRSFSWHLADWFIGVAEVWLVLKFMGYPISLGEAVIIESLTQAVRGAAFAIPGALGAQEGGLIALCAIFGVPPEAALALSLVKRIPDLVIGVPGLLAWQAIEGKHFLHRHSHVRQSENEHA